MDQQHANVVVSVDGPSGSGKSSTSREVARRLGLRYLDTGAMYRAMTWWMLQHDVDVTDSAAVAGRVTEPRIATGTDPELPTITVDGTDVATEIRDARVTAAVSAVSAVPEVRRLLVRQQREAIGGGGIVVEGRDIGTAVVPEAPVKVYLTAHAEARAGRRTIEEGGNDVQATRSALLHRDEQDSTRSSSPLARVDGAYEIDTTDHSLAEVVDRVVGLVEAAEAPR